MMLVKDMTRILFKTSPAKQAATAVDMDPLPRSLVFEHLQDEVAPAPGVAAVLRLVQLMPTVFSSQGKANVLMAVSPAEGTLLLVSLAAASQRPRVVALLSAQVREAVENAESLAKVPAAERWDSVMKLDLESQSGATSWLLAKDIVRMWRLVPASEGKLLLKGLQPEVCGAVLEQMTPAERAKALSALAPLSCSKIMKLLPRPCLVAALAEMDDASALTAAGLAAEHVDAAKAATTITKVKSAAAADAIAQMSPEKLGHVLTWVDPLCSSAAMSELPLAGRKTAMTSIMAETRVALLAAMSPLNRAKALNSLSPAHRRLSSQA